MVTRPRVFTGVVRALERRSLAIRPADQWDDALVRMPRGFTALESSELAPYFHLRSFAVHRPLEPQDIASPVLIERIVRIARDARPLLDFGWRLV